MRFVRLLVELVALLAVGVLGGLSLLVSQSLGGWSLLAALITGIGLLAGAGSLLMRITAKSPRL